MGKKSVKKNKNAAAKGMVVTRAKALAKNLPISAQKGRLVADLVRGLPVAEAAECLQFSRQKAGALLKKVLDSAIANAEENHQADIDMLFVSRVEISEGSRFNAARARFGGRGRVHRIIKARSHFLLELGERQPRGAQQ